MEEDRDLEELKKAIRSGDVERAERIAVTLFKRPSNPKVKGNPDSNIVPSIIAVVAGVAIFALSLVSMWMEHSEKKKRREVAYV